MVMLHINTEEMQILGDVLENDLSDLRMEIADTDSMDFRDSLKLKKAVLMKVIEDIRSPHESTDK